MLNNIIETVKSDYKEKLDVVFEEIRREYEWYCVVHNREQKKRHAENLSYLSHELTNIAEVLKLLE